jgi:hypothetical protein
VASADDSKIIAAEFGITRTAMSSVDSTTTVEV